MTKEQIEKANQKLGTWREFLNKCIAEVDEELSRECDDDFSTL